MPDARDDETVFGAWQPTEEQIAATLRVAARRCTITEFPTILSMLGLGAS